MARFELGRVVATPGALDALIDAGAISQTYLARHAAGDWGDLSNDDLRANDLALLNETRLFSAYVLLSGVKVWIITEADRSATTVLLPDKY